MIIPYLSFIYPLDIRLLSFCYPLPILLRSHPLSILSRFSALMHNVSLDHEEFVKSGGGCGLQPCVDEVQYLGSEPRQYA